MHAFKVIGTVAFFAFSVSAQKMSSPTPASEMPVVTMMWGDSKPADAAVASSAESVGAAMSSQMATAKAEMSGSMTGMSMATGTMKSMSGMSGMSMATAGATAQGAMGGMKMGGAVRESVWGSCAAVVMMGLGAALVV